MKLKDMTPKEKATELTRKFYSINNEDEQNKGTDPYISRDYANQCALICVDEVLKSDPLTPSKFNTKVSKGEAYKQSEDESYYFWQEVKQELNKY